MGDSEIDNTINNTNQKIDPQKMRVELLSIIDKVKKK
jgi:hypothetical protein